MAAPESADWVNGYRSYAMAWGVPTLLLVGPVTVNIFRRELRPYWAKADPAPLPVVVDTARKLKLDLKRYNRKTLAFARLEAGVIRLRHRI